MRRHVLHSTRIIYFGSLGEGKWILTSDIFYDKTFKNEIIVWISKNDTIFFPSECIANANRTAPVIQDSINYF